VLEGDFVVPALAFGPRIGLNAVVSPVIVKGKRRPRLFLGVSGGPSFARPLWGALDDGSSVSGEITVNESNTANLWPSDGYPADGDEFSLIAIEGGEGKFVDPDDRLTRTYVDIQLVLGIQLRL
jgi:hypothetical protein